MGQVPFDAGSCDGTSARAVSMDAGISDMARSRFCDRSCCDEVIEREGVATQAHREGAPHSTYGRHDSLTISDEGGAIPHVKEDANVRVWQEQLMCLRKRRSAKVTELLPSRDKAGAI